MPENLISLVTKSPRGKLPVYIKKFENHVENLGPVIHTVPYPPPPPPSASRQVRAARGKCRSSYTPGTASPPPS